MRFGKDPFMVFALFSAGLAAVLGLIVLLREMLRTFQGNEMSLGILLGTWLFWMWVGSEVPRRRPIKDPADGFVAFQALIALILPLTLYAMRWVRTPFDLAPGELAGPEFILISTAVIILPLGILLGLQLVTAARIGEGLVSAYVLEALGAVAAGLLFSFYLVTGYPAMEVVLLASLLLLFSGGMLLSGRGTRGIRFYGLLLAFFLVGTFYSLGLGAEMDGRSRRMQWEGFDLVQSTDSGYGNVVTTFSEGRFSLFENGVFVLSSYDIETAEEIAHFPMLQHENPGRVLLIGGGAGGTLGEVLRHPVDRVDYVELDPALVEVSRRFALKSDNDALDDPRVRVVTEDARSYLKKTDTKYDVIILDMHPPYNAQLNRFYTEEFFRETAGVLEEDGIISIDIPLSKELVPFDRSVYGTLAGIYPYTMVIPGERTFILATRKRNAFTDNVNTLELRKGRRWLDTVHVNRYLLQDRLDPERVEEATQALQGEFRRNSDDRPAVYYFDAVVWSNRFNGLSSRVYTTLDGIGVYHVLALVLLISALIYLLRRDREMVTPAAAAVGFAGASVLVTLFYMFQVFFGQLYYGIGLFATAFMLGLASGNVYETRELRGMKKPRLEFLKVMGYLTLLALLLPRGFDYFAEYIADPRTVYTFYGTSLLTGGLLGMGSSLAGHLLTSGKKDNESETGAVPAGLFGACAGALAASCILLPILGVVPSMEITAAVTLGGGILLMLDKNR